MTKLSIWIKNNLHNNIKNDLDSTLNALLKLNPPFKKNTSILEQKKALKSSIYAFFENNRENITKYGSLYSWVNNALNKKKLKVIDKEYRAVFQRARFFSSVMQHAIGSLTDCKLKKDLQNQNQNMDYMKEDQEEGDEREEGGDDDEKENGSDDEKENGGDDEKESSEDYEKESREGGEDYERESGEDYEKESDDDEEKDQGNNKKGQEDIVLSSQQFSFSPSEQGAYVVPIIEHVEASLFRFIIKQEKYIPHKTVRKFVSRCNPPKKDDFSDADLLCLLNFIIQNINLFTLGQGQTLFHGSNNIDPPFLLKTFKVEIRHHNAHGVTNLKGRWCDEKLLRLSTLALEVIVCLGKF